jgi:hypothetical protein
MTADEVYEQVEEAMDVLKAMPWTHLLPQGPKTVWPAYVREAKLSYGYRHLSREVDRFKPTGEQIDNLDEVLVWTGYLDTPHRIALLAMAGGVPRKYIAKRLRCSRWTVVRYKDNAVKAILERLNETDRRRS